MDSSSDVNAVNSQSVAKLNLSIPSTSMDARKFDCFVVKTCKMIIARFSIQNKFGKICVFEKSFLLAYTSIKVVLRMFFLTLNNSDIQFEDGIFTWTFCGTTKAFHKVKHVELTNNHEFAPTALDKNSDTFVLHFSVLKSPE